MDRAAGGGDGVAADPAESFLAAYEHAAAVAVPEPALWDLFALANSYRSVETWLPNYHDLGRTDLTAAQLRERHTSWTQVCLARHRAGPDPLSGRPGAA